MESNMMRKVIKRVLSTAVLGCVLCGSIIAEPLNINAAVNEENQDRNSEITDESQEQLKENSWRYQDGSPVYTENNYRARTADYPYAWQKVDGEYRNTKGEVIEGAIKKGIDVSEHNGKIDWNKVKADGIDFAIIRCGYGSNYTSQDDKQWMRNVSECERLKIPYGVYLYSYADTVEKAKSEAQHVLRLLKGHTLNYPVYYDLEDDKMTLPLSSSMKGKIAQVFCDAVSSAGYEVGIYSNLNWWNNYLKDPVFDNASWSKWVAQYNATCSYKQSYDMWQCTSVGQVDGISENVDINFWMENGNTIKNPTRTLYYDAKLGNWCVYNRDGKIDTGFSGLAQNEYGWWYVTKGVLDWNYSGLAQNQYGWWYVTKGAIDWNYTGFGKNEYGWWYIVNGSIAWNYTGVAENKSEKTLWYVQNGLHSTTFTGLAENENGWWYFKDGALDKSFEGLADNQYGWWYVANGTVDWNYVGLAQNKYGWWYVANGTIDWNYIGLAENKYGWWYIQNGAIAWNYTGLIDNPKENCWWYIENGAYNTSFRGLAENEYGWWYVADGTIDWNYTGIAENPYGWWYVENGSIAWSYTGNYLENGTEYNVVNGFVVK